MANGVIVHNSNIEQQGIGYVVHTLRPWLVNWEQELNAKLLRYRQGYFAEFSVEGLLRGDSAARAAFYKEMFFVGAMSPNDIRNKENLNPVDGGDRYYVPLNMVPVGGEGEPAFSEPGVNGIATPSPAAGFPIRSGMTGPGEQRKRRGAVARARAARAGRHGFEEAGTRIVEREKSNVLRAAKKHLGERSLEGWNSWLDDFYRDFPDFIVRQVGGAVLALAELIQPMAAEEVNGEEGMSAEMERFLVEYKRSFALRYRDSSKGQLRSIVDRAEMDPEADPVEVVEMRLGEWEQRRPGKVALNESIVLSNAVAKLVFVDAGITRLRWAAIGGESCPFCQEMDGKIVGVEQPFVAHDTVLQAEGKSDMKIYKPALHPPLHEGCVCQVEPE
uniref:Putative portal protein n=1 Tax=viral metagenome TaxID=1070528 RepID=A0A6H1ZJN4_9ZZZZ